MKRILKYVLLSAVILLLTAAVIVLIRFGFQKNGSISDKNDNAAGFQIFIFNENQTELNVGHNSDEAVRVLRSLDTDKAFFIINENDIIKYDWDLQIIKLTENAGKKFYTAFTDDKNLSEYNKVYVDLYKRVDKDKKDRSLYKITDLDVIYDESLQPYLSQNVFVVKFNGKFLYGGIFCDTMSQLNIPYPVLRILSIHDAVTFSVIPGHNVYGIDMMDGIGNLRILSAKGDKLEIAAPDIQKLKGDFFMKMALETTFEEQSHFFRKIIRDKTVKEFFIKKGKLIKKSHTGCTELMEVCYYGNIEEVKKRLKFFPGINNKNLYNRTALIYACINNQADIVKLLLKHGADIKINDIYNMNALEYAESGGYKEIAGLLTGELDKTDHALNEFMRASKSADLKLIEKHLKKGINVNSVDIYGNNALIYACRENQFEAVKFLIGKKADIEFRDKKGNTPFLIACGTGNPDVADYLLSKKADISVYNNKGQTGSVIAALKDNVDIVRILTAHGRSMTLPFMIASEKGFIDIAKLCISNKIKIDITHSSGITADKPSAGDGKSHEVGSDHYDWTALMYASENGNIDIIKLLLDNGADNNAKDKRRSTPVLIAAENNQLIAVKLLYEKGADINTRNVNGSSVLGNALDNANESGNYEMADFLISKGVRMERDFISNSFLGRFNIVKYLLSKKVNINAKDEFDNTALNRAIEDYNLEMVKLLLLNGADKNIRDSNNKTALEYARDLSIGWEDQEKKVALNDIIKLLENK